jgi:squalene-hopene/tetraprenyl-beta-curcumene cyclase
MHSPAHSRSRRWPIAVLIAPFVWGLLVAGRLPANQPDPAAAPRPAGPSAELYNQVVAKAVAYLESQGQAADGSYSAQAGPGVTALVTAGLLRNGKAPADPLVARSLDYLQRFAHDDGGVYAEGSTHRNYETCLAIMCFKEANADGRYNDLLAKGEAFVKKLQWDAEEGHDLASTSYGGAGYGSNQRPDLSNTSYLIDTLKTLGAGADDPALQAALIFVSRCQNLETEHNTTEFANKNPDGGFYYTIAAGGSSQAGPTDTGGLRSYGSMTYAGLKSMIFAGVGSDDRRVEAALEWIKRNYTLSENPGMGDAGLYYYYHTFAKSLDAVGQPTVVDANGASHDWRRELVEHLARLQQESGAWVNMNERWMEGDPNLATGYVLLALSYCKPTPAEAPAQAQ